MWWWWWCPRFEDHFGDFPRAFESLIIEWIRQWAGGLAPWFWSAGHFPEEGCKLLGGEWGVKTALARVDVIASKWMGRVVFAGIYF
jgi:hypothetical protein